VETTKENSNLGKELRKIATDKGMQIAKRFFDKRGGNSEVHLSREELAALCALAFELGYEHETIVTTE